MSKKLQDFRLLAAAQSRGTSHSRLYRMVGEIISRFPLRGEILDVGAGTGTFLKSLKVEPPFTRMTATDLHAHAILVDPQITWVACDLNEKWASIPSAYFDWVIGIEIIEHLENPRHFLRECMRALKPNGLVLLTTPNNESIRSLLSLIFRGNFVDFTDTSYPAHITPLLASDFDRAAKEAGLEILEIGYSRWGTVPFFTRLEWFRHSFGFFRGKRFSDQIYLLARRRS